MAKQQARQAEVNTLMGLVNSRVDGSDGDAEARKAWLVHNFQQPLEDVLGKAGQNGRRYVLVNVVVIGGGFATSGVAVASRGAGWVVFGIGLAVALAGGLSQQLRFGFRSSESRTLVFAFFNEGWHFVMSTGAYVEKPDDAWARFSERVDALNERAAAVESIESELPNKPKGANVENGCPQHS
jgi:hypothetical protein